ncbi:MAG: hypothetical protein ABC596_05825 [Candidatus Methanosuratincola petrocarbonis]
MATKKRKRVEPPLYEIGVRGLQHFGGVLQEEYLPDLKGTRARKVYREMAETDPIIAALLFAIKQLIRSANWSPEPASSSKDAREAADFLESCLEDLKDPWTDFISESLSFLVYGFALFEINYKIRQGPEAESLWYKSQFEDGRIGWLSLAFRPQDTILKWEFNARGEPVGAIQRLARTYEEKKIPLEKAILFRTESIKGNPEGRSILRATYIPYYYKKRLQTIEAIGCERDLAGLPVIYGPLALWEDPSKQALKDEFLNVLSSLRRDEEEGVLMPRDPDHPDAYELKLLSASGSRQFDIEKIITRYDRAITQTVLADFIMLGSGDKGSWALIREKKSIFMSALLGWLDSMKATFNSQAVARLMALNGIRREDWPTLTYSLPHIPEIEDVAKILEALTRGGAEVFPDRDLERWLRGLVGAPAPPEG